MPYRFVEEEIPEISRNIPGNSPQIPRKLGKIPENSRAISPNSRNIPEIPSEISENSAQIPENFQKLPEIARKFPEISEPKKTRYRFVEQEEKESIPANIGRQIGRTGARITETILGAPRALGEFAGSLIPEKLLLKGAEKLGIKKPVEKGFEFAKKYAPYKLFPSSQQIRKDITQHLFGEKLEPKNEWEKKADDLVSDFAALALPLPGKKLQILKPTMLALGGNIASDVVGHLGGTEKQKTYAKLGTFLAGSLVNPKGADKLRNDLYAQARASRPKDATTNAASLSEKIDHFRTELEKGGSAPSKVQTMKKLDELQKAIKEGKIEVEELEKFKTSINELRSGLYEEFKTNKPGMKAARSNLNKASSLVDDTLKEYGKVNPEWESFYRPANEVHGAIQQSKKVRNMIGKYYKQLTPTTAALLFGVEHAVGLPKTIAAAGAGAAAFQVGELAARVWKSPTLRKYYSGVVAAAARDDALAFKENMDKLEAALSKKE